MPAQTYSALAVTFSAQVIATMVMYAPAVMATAAQADLGVSAGSVGVMTSICYSGAVTATLICGQAISRVGPLRWSQICLALIACGTWIAASANLFLVVAGGILIGAGYGPLTPASSAILVKRTPFNLLATILSIKQTGVPVGGILAGAILPSLILTYNWKLVATILGGLCLFCAFVIQPMRRRFDDADRDAGQTRHPRILDALKMLRENARLLELSAAMFMYAGMQLMFISFFVVYLTENIGLPLISAGGAMAAGMAGSVLARLLWGVLADRLIKPRALLAWLGIGTSTSTLIMALISPGWTLSIIYAVGIAMGMTSVAWNGVFLAEIAHIAPKGDVGMATSAAMLFTYGGVVVFPALCWGMISLTGGYIPMFLIMAALNLLAVLMLCRRDT